MVGREKTPFLFHRAKLLATSSFFKNALTGPSGTDAILQHLQGVNQYIFMMYQHWVYTGTIASRPANDRGCENAEWNRLYGCYKLAHHLDDIAFHNAMIDAFIDAMIKTKKEPRHLAMFVLDDLPPTSPLRKLVIDIWASSANIWASSTGSEVEEHRAPAEFWAAVHEAQMTKSHEPQSGDIGSPWTLPENRCLYHLHDS